MVFFVVKLVTLPIVFVVYRVYFRVKGHRPAAIARDLEIDMCADSVYYKSNFLCGCLFKTYKLFFPVTQLTQLLLYNCNKFLTYKRCEFCAEAFNPGEIICELCENTHLFHPACLDILHEDNLKKHQTEGKVLVTCIACQHSEKYAWIDKQVE